MNTPWNGHFSGFELVAKSDTRPRSIVNVGPVPVGGSEFVVMAGPCSVENEHQLLTTAESVARSGARILRGGAFKPRSSPYAFQGLGEDGLKILAKARKETGLAIVTEVMSETDVDLVAEYSDMMQIGARSMENFSLLEAVARCGRPVLLKRGMCATLQDLMRSAQFVAENGNPNIILCERGIRTFEKATRNTFDISAVPVLNLVTHLPVIVDPSHASGVRAIVPPLSRAAVVVGAAGLLVEVHPQPDKALSDGEQSLTFAEFRSMMRSLRPYLAIRAVEESAAALPEVPEVLAVGGHA